MKKVLEPTTDSFREKGSKFIGHLFPADSIEAFEEELEALESEYPDATHHCYAWRLDPTNIQEFAQDDGEPSGTAGLPILNQLKSYKVVEAGLVVVRYYGGTNLGKSGLIEAYGRSAEHCLTKAQLKTLELIQKVEVTYPYSMQSIIEKLKHHYNLKEFEANYLEEVSLTLGCPSEHVASFKKSLKQLSHRDIKCNFLGKTYIII